MDQRRCLRVAGPLPDHCPPAVQPLARCFRLLEAEEASLHLAKPAALAAFPQGDTCRGHQAFASGGRGTGSRLLDAFFGEVWETGSETAGDRPKVTQEFPLQLWAPPAYGAIHPSLRQSSCSAHVAQGPGGNPTPPLFSPLPAPGRRRPDAEKRPPPPVRSKTSAFCACTPTPGISPPSRATAPHSGPRTPRR